MAASQIPFPRAVFYDANGAPLASGFVWTYVASTTTPKTTWQDVGEITPNSNPILLDSNGSCLLFGTSSYSLAVQDSLGNQVPAYSGLTYTTSSGPIFYASDYGAVGDGSTDNAAAINAALTAATSAGGGTVLFGAGTFNCGVAITVPNNVTLAGVNRGATTLNMTVNANPNINLQITSKLTDMQIVSSISQTGIMVQMSGNASEVSGCLIQNYFIGVAVVGSSSSNLVVGPIIDGNEFFNPVQNASAQGINLQNFSTARITNNIMAGLSVGTQPGASVYIQNGDTCIMSQNNFTLHGPLNVSPGAALNCFALQMTNCYFDSATAAAAAIFASAGNIYDTVADGCWFGLASSHGILIAPTGSGVVSGMEITGCQFPQNGGSGIRISGSGGGVAGINITGGRSEGNAQNGAHVDGTTVSGVAFNGFRAGNYGGRGGNGGNGILTGGALDHYVITGCSLYGNTGAGLSDTASGSNKVVANNLTS